MLATSRLAKKFYWSGGTALSECYLKHRISHDIDLFTDHDFSYQELAPFLESCKNFLRLTKIEEHKLFDRWEFFLHNGGELRVEFAKYEFKALHKRKKMNGVLVDSLDDLAANKTLAAVDRHEPKDVVDVYSLMTQKKITLSKLINLAHKKSGLTIRPLTLVGDLLVTARQLNRVQTLLPGSAAKQKQAIQNIQKYFAKLSAKLIKDSL